MTHRKSVCVKWTLVFLIVVFSPFVYTRPQETVISSTANNVQNDKATENPIRYRYRQKSSTDSFKLPIVIGLDKITNKTKDKQLSPNNINAANSELLFSFSSNDNRIRNSSSRTNRMITKTVIHDSRNNERKKSNTVVNKNVKNAQISTSRKPAIKKVLTKWTDKTKYEDLNFSYEASTSTERDADIVASTNSLSLDLNSESTENVDDQSGPTGKRPRPYYPNKFYNKLDNNKKYHPELETHESLGVVHSNKVHIIEYPFPSVRPAYVFTTPRPTPIITNVGNPKPWNPHKQVKRKPTPKPVRQKPLKTQYNHNNNYPHYPEDNFEVTTFEPTNAYTERIVIRPEEYAATNDDCPTIFLTLNNTFQGQGKEACPDLNIAVNTNVVNKNVVVESDEEDAESIFPGGFGLPLGADSEADEGGVSNDYFESDERDELVQSGSVEGTGLSNYNAAIQDSSDAGGTGGSHNAGLAAHKPGRPGGNKDEDDPFSFSSVVSFFKPAVNAMAWLAAINPFSFSIMSILLTPIVMLVAGYSGVAALFAPLGLGREASPKIVHVYRPKWEWDDKYKTWYLNSFPDNRRWKPVTERIRTSKELETDEESVRPTFFYKLKEWMKNVTKKLKERENNNLVRKNKRRKRETWTRRVK